MLDLIVAEQKGQKLSVDSAFIEGIRSTLTNTSLDKVSVKVNFYLPRTEAFLVNTVVDPFLSYDSFCKSDKDLGLHSVTGVYLFIYQ